MIKLSLIHPSRQRPKQAFETYLKWKSNRTTFNEEIEYILVLDRSDPTVFDYIDLFKGNYTGNEFHDRYFIDSREWTVDKVNYAARRSNSELLMFIADDYWPNYGWDEDLFAATEGLKDFVMKVNDGHPKHATHPVMDRVYYKRQGYFFNPEYQHMYCDTELSCKAYIEGKFYERLDIEFIHDHPKRPADFDEIYKKGQSTMRAGKEIFKRNIKNAFGIENPIKNLPDNFVRI